MRFPSLGAVQVIIGLATMAALGTHAAHYIAVFGVTALLVYGWLCSRQH